jgi:predicted O-linked N-acetylglucosamine transferase (SPINDLY family)
MAPKQQLQRALDHHRAGRLREAAAIYAKLLARNPRQPEVLQLMGTVCQQLGELDEAARLFGRAIALKPGMAQAHANLGHVLQRSGKLAEAAAAFEQAIALKPDLLEAHDALGTVRQHQGRPDDAIACYRAVLARQPDVTETQVNLATVLNAQGHLEEAATILNQVIARHPELPEAHNNLGCVLRDQGRFAPALASFRRALALRPRYERAHSNLIATMDWAPGTTVADAQAERRRWYLANRRTGVARLEDWPNPPEPARKLRLGYVSGDFRRHSAAYAFGPVLWGHDRRNFEVVCYAQVSQGDDMTARFRAAADLWRPIVGVSDDALVRQIRADAIDVLIDLSGHTVGNRLAVFTAKPAPVQVSAWGSITGTGIPEIDALFADAIMIPADERALFAETVVDLPCMLTYQAPEYAPAVGPLPAAGAGHVTFGCLNRFAKVTEETLAMWARVLEALPTSRLLLKDKVFANPAERAATVARLGGLGVAEARLVFQGGTDHRGHLAAHGDVDIGLDPYPQNGGISTLEALWMGVPVVTRVGTTPQSRVGGALMTALGMGDLVARDADGYVAAARRLAGDLTALAARRAVLRDRILRSPVGDVPRYVAAVEAAYRQLWWRWCAARGVAVPPPPDAAAVQRQVERALARHMAGRVEEAVAAYREVLARAPDNFDALHLLGVAYRKLGRLDEAERHIARALALNPNFATAHNNHGNVLRDLGRCGDAEAAYRRAIALEPANAGAHANLGNVLAQEMRIGEAAEVLRHALALAPDATDAHNAYGAVLWRQGKLDEAIREFRRVVALDPRDAKALSNLGLVLFDRGDMDASVESYRAALAIAPHYPGAHSNLIFAMDSMPRFSIADVQEERRRWYEAHRRPPAAARAWPNPPEPERRLRVGYVSGDFCRHSAAFCFGPVVWDHDRAGFEVVCYSNGIETDDFTTRFREAADVWRVVGHLPDDALEATIRADAIDLLVDLSGHTSSNRLPVFTAKPAPVQLTAWGNVSGTGIPEIDYLLADPIVVPPDERALFAETVIDLPCALSHLVPDALPELNPLPARAAGHVTFGCLNRFSKVSDAALTVWARILDGCPGSRLLLKDRLFSDPAQRQRVVERLAGFGIAAARVDIRGATDRPAHLATYREVDLALDPFPQNGGITSLEGLWMGVPAVTRLGATVAGRITASILSALDMADLIARGDDDYVALALARAADPDGLAALRAGLRARLAASPVGNAALYVGAVERAYREAWRHWCATR